MSGADVLGPGQSCRVSLTSDTANLAGLRSMILQAAACVGFGEPEVSQIVLAVDEAIANVIKHGYEGQPGQPIDVSIAWVRRDDRPALQVIIEDLGRQVAPDSIVGRNLDDIRPGGLGTHIIRNIMDEVEYSIRQPRGMSLRMIKAVDAGHGEIGPTCEAEGSANG